VDSKRILLPHAKSSIFFAYDLPARSEWIERVGKYQRHDFAAANNYSHSDHFPNSQIKNARRSEP
jgi:hypothetical protein